MSLLYVVRSSVNYIRLSTYTFTTSSSLPLFSGQSYRFLLWNYCNDCNKLLDINPSLKIISFSVDLIFLFFIFYKRKSQVVFLNEVRLGFLILRVFVSIEMVAFSHCVLNVILYFTKLLYNYISAAIYVCDKKKTTS